MSWVPHSAWVPHVPLPMQYVAVTHASSQRLKSDAAVLAEGTEPLPLLLLPLWLPIMHAGSCMPTTTFR